MVTLYHVLYLDLTELIKETLNHHTEPPTYHKRVRGGNGVGSSPLYGEGTGAQFQASSQTSDVPQGVNTEKPLCPGETSPSSPSHSSPDSSNQLRGQSSAVFKVLFPCIVVLYSCAPVSDFSWG